MTTRYRRNENRKVLIPTKITLSPPRKSKNIKQRFNVKDNNEDIEENNEVAQMKFNILKQVDQKKVHKVRLKVSSLREIEKPSFSVDAKSYHRNNNNNNNKVNRKQIQSPQQRKQDVVEIDNKKKKKNIEKQVKIERPKPTKAVSRSGLVINNDNNNNNNKMKEEKEQLASKINEKKKNIIKPPIQSDKQQQQQNLGPSPSFKENKVDQQNIVHRSNNTNNNNTGSKVDTSRAIGIANLINRFRNAPPTKRSERRKKTLQEIDDMLLDNSSTTSEKLQNMKNSKESSNVDDDNNNNKQVIIEENKIGKKETIVIEQNNDKKKNISSEKHESSRTTEIIEDLIAVEENNDNDDDSDEIIEFNDVEDNKSNNTMDGKRRWYFINHNQQDSRNGPFTTKEMFAYIVQDILVPMSPVWCQGLPEWIPLKAVPIFINKFMKLHSDTTFPSSTTPPPPPPAPSTIMQQRPRPPLTKRPKIQSIKTLNTSIDLKNHTQMLEDYMRNDDDDDDTIEETSENDDSTNVSSSTDNNNNNNGGNDMLNKDDWYQRHVHTVLSEVLLNKSVDSNDNNGKVADGDAASDDDDDDDDDEYIDINISEDDIEEDDAEEAVKQDGFVVKNEENMNVDDILSTVGINTETIVMESRGTDVMKLSSATQVDLNIIHRDNNDFFNNGAATKDDIKVNLSPIKLENPIVQSLDMLQNLISRVSKEKSILQQKKLGISNDHTSLSSTNMNNNISDSSNLISSSININTNNVNGLIKNLINTVETERSRIASLRHGV